MRQKAAEMKTLKGGRRVSGGRTRCFEEKKNTKKVVGKR